jgi:hypothetical protein
VAVRELTLSRQDLVDALDAVMIKKTSLLAGLSRRRLSRTPSADAELRRWERVERRLQEAIIAMT